MNNRVQNDIRLLQKHLVCDVKYQKSDKDITFFVKGQIGEVELPIYRMVLDSTKDDAETLEAWSDMAMGRLTQELIQVVSSTERSDLRDTLNKGLAIVRDRDEPDDTDKTVEEFNNTDFRSQLNLLDTRFNDIKVVPIIDEAKLDLYFTKNDAETYIASVNKDSNVIRVLTAFTEKVKYKPSETFVNALRNQIREFKEVFRDNLIAEKEEKLKKKEAKENGKKHWFIRKNIPQTIP